MEKVMKLTNMDFPDPDVIRVGDTYYMISTTMHFCPGGQILSSKDLVHWKHEAYVYEKPEITEARKLTGSQHIYGKGMWAASLRYHEGMFYVCFVANDTQKTYLYKAEKIQGPWLMHEIEGFYHDCSLLFEEGKAYLVYGNTQIYITELNETLSAPRKGGFHKRILEENGDVRLGYEGAHLYKIDGRYYLFLIHWPNAGAARRTQACFVADSLDGEWQGKDIFDWDGGFRNCGVAQGGIVDTPDGKYYAIMFQDSGAVGRIPVLVPVEFEDGFPKLCDHPEPEYGVVLHQNKGEELYCSNFASACESGRLDPRWQWNHVPDDALWSLREGDVLTVSTDKTVSVLPLARNILTQRMLYPSCAAEVTVDASELQNGDYAGICALQGSFAMIAIHKRANRFYLVMRRRLDNGEVWGFSKQEAEDEAVEEIAWDEPIVRLRLEASFAGEDLCQCFYRAENEWKRLGCVHPLVFRLDHFTGCRFGLFVYSTDKPGKSASFCDFSYQV